MLITFFPCLWHGICEAFTAEIAESAEKDRDRGKATANGTAFTAEDAEIAEKGGEWGERRNGTAFNAEHAEACPERAACPEPVEGSESKGRRGKLGGKKVQNAECRMQNGRQTADGAARLRPGAPGLCRGKQGEKQDGVDGNASRRKSPLKK